MSKVFPITTHTIVKNEDRFVYYALMSVAPYVSNMIIYDTGSSDNTVLFIDKFINFANKKYPNLSIIFEEINVKIPEEIDSLRKQQISKTNTPWFMLLDGDEIWNQKELFKLFNFMENISPKIMAIVNNTRNCVGDIWHYLPEQFGKYRLLDKIGHLNIRLMRTADYDISGVYPNEGYYINNQLINNQNGLLAYCDAWYLHTTHLKRSSVSDSKILGRRKVIYSLGLKLSKSELPEVFKTNNLSILKKRDRKYILRAKIYDYLRDLFRFYKDIFAGHWIRSVILLIIIILPFTPILLILWIGIEKIVKDIKKHVKNK